MLALKNPFSKTPPPTLPSAPAAQALVKGKQLLTGRTRTRVEALTAERDAAQLEVRQKQHNVGERRADDLDITGAMEELKQVQDRLGAIEAALAVAVHKDEAAQAELRQAERHASRTALAEAEARLNARGPEGEALFVALEEFCIAVARDKETLRLARLAAGAERHCVDVAELSGQFGRSAARAGHPLTGAGLLPSGFIPYPSWIACVTAVCGVKAQP